VLKGVAQAWDEIEVRANWMLVVGCLPLPGFSICANELIRRLKDHLSIFLHVHPDSDAVSFPLEMYAVHVELCVRFGVRDITLAQEVEITFDI